MPRKRAGCFGSSSKRASVISRRGAVFSGLGRVPSRLMRNPTYGISSKPRYTFLAFKVAPASTSLLKTRLTSRI